MNVKLAIGVVVWLLCTAVPWFWLTAFIAAMGVDHPTSSWAPTFWIGFGNVSRFTGGLVLSVWLIAAATALEGNAWKIQQWVNVRKADRKAAAVAKAAETERILKAEGLDL